MAQTVKTDMSCARVKKYTSADVGKAERHNERKNETYENMNVIKERIPLNVHFKKPTAPTYMEQLRQMEQDGQSYPYSTRNVMLVVNYFSVTAVNYYSIIHRLAKAILQKWVKKRMISNVK